MQFTDAPYRRSHGEAPEGFGQWAFAASYTEVAFDGDLVEQDPDSIFRMFWASGTLTEAKAIARRHFELPDVKGRQFDYIAILP